MLNLTTLKAEAKAWISAKPLLGVAIGIVIGFLLKALF